MALAAILAGIIIVLLFLAATLALSRKRRRGQKPIGSPPR
jgi:hypothetical protein